DVLALLAADARRFSLCHSGPLGYRRCRNTSSSTTEEADQAPARLQFGDRQTSIRRFQSNFQPAHAGVGLLLLTGDRLCRTLTGAGIGVGALSADRQATTVTQAAIVAQIHQTLDVHGNVAAKITFHDIVAVD